MGKKTPTKEPIEQQNPEATKKTFSRLLPQGMTFAKQNSISAAQVESVGNSCNA